MGNSHFSLMGTTNGGHSVKLTPANKVYKTCLMLELTQHPRSTRPRGMLLHIHRHKTASVLFRILPTCSGKANIHSILSVPKIWEVEAPPQTTREAGSLVPLRRCLKTHLLSEWPCTICLFLYFNSYDFLSSVSFSSFQFWWLSLQLPPPPPFSAPSIQVTGISCRHALWKWTSSSSS